MGSMRTLIAGVLCAATASAKILEGEKPCVLPDGWDLVGNPELCRRIRFTCPEGMEVFTGHECGCGCKPKPCELPDGWVLKGTPEQCPLIRFTCPAGMEYFGGHKCGCGCKPAIVERCPRGYVREGDDCVTEEGRCSYPKIDMIVVGGAAFVDPVTGKLTSSRSVRCGTWDECTWQWAVRGPSSCTIFAP